MTTPTTYSAKKHPEEARALWKREPVHGEKGLMKHTNTPYLQEILDEIYQGIDETKSILQCSIYVEEMVTEDESDAIIFF